MTFTPLINYAGYEHVLNALPCCQHPVNGNVYGIAIEKQAGVRQNLSVYRVRPGSLTRELVHRYIGGVDSQAQIAAGGCLLHPDGSLEVWASAVPFEPPITKTGFVGGFWPRIPNVDDPWSISGATLFPAVRTSSLWEGRVLNGGVLVDVPAVFGVPAAAIYKIRFVALSDAPDTRVRAGTQACPFFVTVNTQIAGQQVHTTGDAPGPQLWVSAVNKAGDPATAQVWLQICGVG